MRAWYLQQNYLSSQASQEFIQVYIPSNNLVIFAMDFAMYKKQIAPLWYLRLKAIVMLLVAIS